MKNLEDRLKSGDVIVGDGGWGTMIMQRGLRRRKPPTSLIPIF
ncbi:MAG: hypothetical protein PHY09_02190 [Desulfuromonadaceae bacterium]|nr:hypothetical protein [Desulfuromonadaceae bacterium]MDD5105590.1 hypothetical protein [Desulfuromonadaceae bacterium]